MSKTKDMVHELENEYELLIAEIADKSVTPGLAAVQADLRSLIEQALDASKRSSRMIDNLNDELHESTEVLRDLQSDIEAQMEPIADVLPITKHIETELVQIESSFDKQSALIGDYTESITQSIKAFEARLQESVDALTNTVLTTENVIKASTVEQAHCMSEIQDSLNAAAATSSAIGHCVEGKTQEFSAEIMDLDKRLSSNLEELMQMLRSLEAQTAKSVQRVKTAVWVALAMGLINMVIQMFAR
jgi:chromosome segregation ATPase